MDGLTLILKRAPVGAVILDQVFCKSSPPSSSDGASRAGSDRMIGEHRLYATFHIALWDAMSAQNRLQPTSLNIWTPTKWPSYECSVWYSSLAFMQCATCGMGSSLGWSTGVEIWEVLMDDIHCFLLGFFFFLEGWGVGWFSGIIAKSIKLDVPATFLRSHPCSTNLLDLLFPVQKTGRGKKMIQEDFPNPFCCV